MSIIKMLIAIYYSSVDLLDSGWMDLPVASYEKCCQGSLLKRQAECKFLAIYLITFLRSNFPGELFLFCHLFMVCI